MGVESATLVPDGVADTLRQANPAQTADVSLDAAVERLGDALAVRWLLQFACIVGISEEGYLRQDGGHVGPDQHHERSLLDTAIPQSPIAVFQVAIKRLLHIGGKLARLVNLILEGNFL